MKNWDHILSQAFAHQQRGEFGRAAQLYQSILTQNPRHIQAIFLLGTVYCQTRQPDQAITLLNGLLKLKPDHAEALNSLGSAFQLKNDFAQAIACYQKSLALKPNSPSAQLNLAHLFFQDCDFENALMAYEKALSLQPGSDAIFMQIGFCLRRIGRSDEAIIRFEQVLKKNPNSSAVLNAIGLCHKDEARYGEAKSCFENIINRDPQFFDAYGNLAKVLASLGEMEKAIQCCDAGLRINPKSAELHFNKSRYLIANGDFQNAWTEVDWRLQLPAFHNQRLFPQPLWDGTPLRGKTLLVHMEQGVGDEIFYSCFLPEVFKQDGKILIVCEKRLVQIFQTSFPQAQVFARGSSTDTSWIANLPHADWQIPILSLGRFVRKSLADFPQQSGYLVVPPEKRKIWEERLVKLGPGLKVGIAWKSRAASIRFDPDPTTRKQNSLRLEDYLPLLKLPHIHFISLQYGDVEDEIRDVEARYGVRLHRWDDVDLFHDLDGVFALSSALDGAIGIMSAPTTITASLGIPTWVLVTQAVSHLIKIREGRSLFQPSVRVVTQTHPGDWSQAIAQVTLTLQEMPSPALS